MKHLFGAGGLAAVLSLSLLGGSPVAAISSTNIVCPCGGRPSVLVTLKCFSNPERTKITYQDWATGTVTILEIGSTYRLHPFEPFGVNKTLSPGQSVTFQTGPASWKHALSRWYIYDDNGLDGVRIYTSKGGFTAHC